MAQTQKNYLNILYLKVAESNFYIGSFIQIYVYTCENSSHDYRYRSRVWQRKRARAFADTGGVDRIEEALQRQRCSVAGPFLMYVIVICFLIVSG